MPKTLVKLSSRVISEVDDLLIRAEIRRQLVTARASERLEKDLAYLFKPAKGEVGSGAITGLFTVGILAFVLYIVVANFWPSAQDANADIQANTATDAGTKTSKSFFSMGLFLIPVAIFVALFVMLIKRVRA